MVQRQRQCLLLILRAAGWKVAVFGAIFAATLVFPAWLQAKLTSLGQPPPWGQLEQYQNSITAERFLKLINEVYGPGNSYDPWIRIENQQARIRLRSEEEGKDFILKFATPQQSTVTPPRYWRPLEAMPPVANGSPLSGLRIVLDPGHIGGSYGPMEERSFPFEDGPPIQEGDMTLQVALYLQQKLFSLGAKVWLTRSEAEPATNETVENLMPTAFKKLKGKRLRRADADAQIEPREIRNLSELLFYRVSEIRTRAEKINRHFKPDLVLALHFNGSAWMNVEMGHYSRENHFHILINGAYSREELSNDDVRFEMLVKLLSRTAKEEIALGEALLTSIVKANGLPPYIYKTPNSVKVGASPYLWARNLMANRLYRCPVIYLEPYVLNNREVAERARAGDYEGWREVAGALRKSLIREYADGIVEGLLDYYNRQ